MQTLPGDIQCFGSGTVIPTGAIESFQGGLFLDVVERFVHEGEFGSALFALWATIFACSVISSHAGPFVFECLPTVIFFPSER